MKSLLVNFILIIPIMAGYPSNLAKMFSPTEQFPQHILPSLPLYNAQWWGYESLTAIVLVTIKISSVWQYQCNKSFNVGVANGQTKYGKFDFPGVA